jgi:predicted nucleic acid-binding protein
VILGIDTDVLVHWAMAGASEHAAVRRFLADQVRVHGVQLGLTAQVAFEFLHVVTDARRFEHPMAMPQAQAIVDTWWAGPEVKQIVPAPSVVPRTLQLMRELRLGRKRILDTALAATLEAAGVRRITTLNGGDYEAFDFLTVVSPPGA